VEGSSTGGIVVVCRCAVNLRDLARFAASALEVSIVIPAIGGRARVSAVKVFGMGRLYVEEE